MLNATPFLRLYAHTRSRTLARQGTRAYCEDVQRETLQRLLEQGAPTQFGRDHRFAQISTVEEYQRAVPLRRYEQFWNEYWKPRFPRLKDCTWPGIIPYLPVSSGTSSGTTKWIPCSAEMIRSNNKAGLDLLVHHINCRPASQILGGRSFMLGGSTDLVEQAPGIFSGDLSGIAVKAMPWWARARYFPPAELALLKNWEEKIDILARRSLDADIRMISGVPSWLLIFFGKLRELTGKELLADIYPNLEMLVHGGVNFAPYRSQFERLLKNSHAELREVYPASEGFIATADRGSGEGLRMNIDNGIFYEFVPLEELDAPNPTRHWIRDVELNVNYAVVLTTCAGLWSYVLGDTVRFVEASPPRLLITGRTSYYLSAFGEHLIAEEIEDAVSHAAGALGAVVSDYSVGPVYPEQAGDLGGHLYLIEPAGEPPSDEQSAEFSRLLDRRLCERNEDYEAHRAKGFGLRPPAIRFLRAGTFAAWMKSRGKLGGQNKVPRIIMDRSLFASLQTFAEDFARQ